MTRQRTFRSFQPSAPEGRQPDMEPITFTLEGGPPLSVEQWSEVFTCVPVAPAGVLDDLASMVIVDAFGRQTYNAPSIMRFIRGVLIDSDVERFERLAHDKQRVVQLDTLGQLMLWLSEELLGRPTTPPSS